MPYDFLEVNFDLLYSICCQISELEKELEETKRKCAHAAAELQRRRIDPLLTNFTNRNGS
jgi:uncharacterized metal-binding protein